MSKSETKHEKPSKVKTQSFEDFCKDDKVLEYVKILDLTGNLPKALEQFDLMEQKALQANYYQWDRAGRVKPKMPEMQAVQVPVPVDLFRVLQRGKEFLYYDMTGGEKVGVDYKDGRVSKYTLEYTTETAQKLLQEQEELNEPSQRTNCYMIIDGQTKIIHAKDFIKPFEEIAQAIRSNQYVF